MINVTPLSAYNFDHARMVMKKAGSDTNLDVATFKIDRTTHFPQSLEKFG